MPGLLQPDSTTPVNIDNPPRTTARLRGVEYTAFLLSHECFGSIFLLIQPSLIIYNPYNFR